MKNPALDEFKSGAKYSSEIVPLRIGARASRLFDYIDTETPHNKKPPKRIKSWAGSFEVRAATDIQHVFTLSPCFGGASVRDKMDVQEFEHRTSAGVLRFRTNGSGRLEMNVASLHLGRGA